MMTKILFLFCCVVSSAWSVRAQEKITTVILIRHAEKASDGTDNPDLKPEGVARAQHLAEVLKHTTVDAIYSTAFKRTRNTVAPLAQAKAVNVQPYDPSKPEEIDALLKKYAGGTIVICGHSNTTPRLANTLLGKEQFKEFDDTAFDNLLVISVIEKGKSAKATWLTY